MIIEPFQRGFSVEDIILKMGGSIVDNDIMDESFYHIPTKKVSVFSSSTILEKEAISKVSPSVTKKRHFSKEAGVVIYEYKSCSVSGTISKMDCIIVIRI